MRHRFVPCSAIVCLLATSIVGRVAHEPFAAFVEDRIFRPLQMNHSTVYEAGRPIYHRAMGYARDSTGAIIPSDQSVTSATEGDGGVYTSLADYAKWARAIRANRLVNLPSALRRLRFPVDDRPGRYYAAGWFISGSSPEVLFHSGSTCGFATYVVQIPDGDWSITYFSNLAGNTAPFRQLLAALHRHGFPDLAPVLQLQALTR